jgi:hypothetical protein
MSEQQTVLILSDIHYACDAEQERRGHESRIIDNPALRLGIKLFRHFIWLRHPLEHNGLLDQVLNRVNGADLAVAIGDYSCDTAFVGVSDDAACLSAQESLGKLRARFGPNLRAVIGDHELGKMSLVGGQGGMRLASWHRTRQQLGLVPFWREELGEYVLMGVTSSLIALPVFDPETLPEERTQWRQLRAEHMDEIQRNFERLRANQRVLLFCHDPTALPFLWQNPDVRRKLGQVEQTLIGHLHSEAVLWKSKLLAGMPAIGFLGNSVRRMSSALNQARCWRDFRVRLCPSLAGIELLKDGGYYLAFIEPSARRPVQFQRHRLKR